MLRRVMGTVAREWMLRRGGEQWPAWFSFLGSVLAVAVIAIGLRIGFPRLTWSLVPLIAAALVDVFVGTVVVAVAWEFTVALRNRKK